MGSTLRFLLFLTTILVGCTEQPTRSAAKQEAQETSSTGETVDESSVVRKKLRVALDRLSDSRLERREESMEAIKAIVSKGVSDEEISAIISAASAQLPPMKSEWATYDSALIQSVWRQAKEQHVALIAAQYPQLSPRGKPAALAALANIGTQAATRTYTDLLREHGWPEVGYPAMTMPFERTANFGEILLPAFSDGSIEGLPESVRDSVLLAYGTAGRLPPDVAAQVRPAAVDRAQALVARLSAAQSTDGIAWRWADEYMEDRINGGLAFDLLGHLGKAESSVSVLRAGEALLDPRPRMFALLSLVRLGEQPSPRALEIVAGDSETRGILFGQLSMLGKSDLFPRSELTQEKLAESDMVGWLTYPTELGRAPDVIELMKTIEVDTGELQGGVFVYYVFRFKTDPPHWAAEDGWMAGVSGPFRRLDFPTTESWGDTFSTFTKWDEFDPNEHLSSVQDLLKQWRDHHNSQ